MAIIPKQCNINENNGMNASKWNNLRKNINGQVHPMTVDSRLSIQIPQKFPVAHSDVEMKGTNNKYSEGDESNSCSTSKKEFSDGYWSPDSSMSRLTTPFQQVSNSNRDSNSSHNVQTSALQQQPSRTASIHPFDIRYPPNRLLQLYMQHRGELSIYEKYQYDLTKAQLKASSRTSALLAGFAMVALVELQYQDTTPKPLLIALGVVTTLLVSVHLLALMISTCLLPYIEANGCTQDSPHIKLKFYTQLAWLFSTCIGLILFLVEIGVIFFVKFDGINYRIAAYVTTAMLVPVVIAFAIISYKIHKNRLTHTIQRVNDKVVDLQKFLSDAEVGGQQQKNAELKRSLTSPTNMQGSVLIPISNS